MLENQPVKHAISVSEMAQNLGLSRQRLNQLIRIGKMPEADKDANSNRPFFTIEKQRVCLEIRRTGCGRDGAPILFYARRKPKKSPAALPKKDNPKVHPLAEYLSALGQNPTYAEIDLVLRRIYPKGHEDLPIEEIIPKVYAELTKNGE